MALKLCTFNCKGFNLCKVKHIESLLATCDVLLLQETWCLPDQVGKLNRYFREHNTYGVSGITDNELLVGRPYGGVSFLYKKSMSPHIEWVEMSSKRVCCLRLTTNIGVVFLFNVYMPCDTANHVHLFEYNTILSDIAKCCTDNGVLNCIIGGDINTDLSRLYSGNTISLQKFVAQENLSLALSAVDNTIEHTYRGFNNSVSLIDHFIVSENIQTHVEEYYTEDSIDNLSDHIPLFIQLRCIVESVPINVVPVMQSKPVWGLAHPHHIQKYQLELNELLCEFLPADEMFMGSSMNSLCLKKEYITNFHDNIITASYLSMQKHIPYNRDAKAKVIPGWDIEMDIARDKSMFWHGIWRECGKLHTGVLYNIMKKTRSTYHYMLRALKKKKHCKIKESVSKSMLKTNNKSYWKSSKAIRKNNFNCTNVVDGVEGGSNIANLFKDKYECLFNSVKSSHDEHNSMVTQLELDVEQNCIKDETCKVSECVHCHLISSSDVLRAITKLKTDKVNDNGLVFSNNFIHGTDMMNQYLSILYTSMVFHGFCPPSFICANIIPIPKGSKVNLSNSDKYRSIAISSLLGKILDHIIIERQSEALKTSHYQYGFKPNSSTVLCSTMVNETVQYYTENGGKPVYVLLLDASKAFDKVAFNVLFNELKNRSVCPRITKLLYYMYTNQVCTVKWNNELSDCFNVSNGVKQGGVISSLLFSCYIDNLFSQLQHSGLGCHVGLSYAGAFGYADDIALLAPSLQCLKGMISICEEYARSHSITFNPNKSKLLCYNADLTGVVPQLYLNGEIIPVVESNKHLGNYISTNIHDRNIIGSVSDLYQRSNWVISDFRACDSNTLDNLHRTYCMHMYGCELWDLNCNYVTDFKVAWRKIKRRIWRLPYRAHNVIVHSLSYDIDHQLDTRMTKFVYSCLNHSNSVCRSLLSSKLHCVRSTFAANYKYLSYKYNISQDEWFTDLSHLIKKVDIKFHKDFQNQSTVNTIVELCAIRDDVTECGVLSRADACKLIDLISLQ